MREMKDSGVEWIGEIPASWELSKIGEIYEERNVKVSDSDYAPLSVTKKGIVPQLETAAKTDNGDNRKLICKNDFVINSRSDRRGSCGISEYDGSCSLINIVLKPRKNMHNAYYNFVFHSESFADEFYAWGNGIVDDLWSTKWSSMKHIYIPAPPIEEQYRIASYLDDKCSRIDAIIATHELIIAKLKEYRASLITETVTRGLNPDAELKDSGVEWIGKIPVGWSVSKIGRCYTITLGKMLAPTQKEEGETLENYLCAVNIKWEGVNTDIQKQMWLSVSDKQQYKLYNGDLLIMEGGMAGTACIYRNELSPCYFQNSILRCQSKNGFDNRFLYYWLYFTCSTGYIESICNRATILHYTKEKVSATPIVVIPLSEQAEIASYLDDKCSRIDDNIRKRELLIKKLTEYKKSLIYETVTGKKEV